MRKIEVDMVKTVKSMGNWKTDNTEVKSGLMQSHVYLHGNQIAYYDHAQGKLVVNVDTLRKYPTATTKSRLNALGANVFTRKGIVYVNGVAI